MSPLGLALGISRIVSQWPIRCSNVPLLLAKLVERLHNTRNPGIESYLGHCIFGHEIGSTVIYY
jgi:hypothetical protein